jgi:hypothetical protein
MMISRGYNESPRASGSGLTVLISGPHWRRTVWESVERVALAGRLLGLLNFLAFLATGSSRSLLERILRIRLVPLSSQLRRTVAFEFLNRQLLWQALTVSVSPLSLSLSLAWIHESLGSSTTS